MNVRTETGDRPDLSEIPVNLPVGFIGYRIYPKVDREKDQGTLYYQAIQADTAIQTDRVRGVAPAVTWFESSKTTFLCEKKEKRYGIDWDEVPNYGGIEKADSTGGKLAKRMVAKDIEDDHAAALFDTTSMAAAIDVSDGLFKGIKLASAMLQPFDGKTALVCSHFLFVEFGSTEEFTTLMATSFTGLSKEDVLSAREEAIIAAIQAIYPVDEILIGDDRHWKLTGNTDKFALVKLPDVDEDSQLETAVLGKTVVYADWDGDDFEVSSVADGVTKANYYDAKAKIDINELNSAAKVILSYTAPVDATTTTTTTDGA
jgi:hypothetical protein